MNADKIINTLGYFAQRQGGSINCMKAYKLIWLADRYHLRQYGRTITGDRYFAMQHGLVPSDAKNIVEGETPRHVSMTDGLPTGISHDRQGYTYSYSRPVESDLFSESDREVLDLIWQTYGAMDQWQLSELSHLSPEWKQCEAQLGSDRKSMGVETDLFFDNFDDGHGLFLDSPEKMAATRDFYHLFNR